MSENATPRLGYIGLGNQGAPMAKRYLDWPGGLTVFDVRADAMTPFAEGGATAAGSLAEVADADIIGVTVLNDAQVREVVAELASHAKPGTIIAIHSTISHTTAVELAEQLKPQGVHIADAPVSGGGKAADKGELAVMVGADDETFERIKGPFSRWASVVIHAGEAGDGTKMKLARNMLTFIIYSAVGESQKLADEAGLNLNDLAKVVRHSDALTGGASSIMYRSDSKPLAPDHFLYQPFLHTRALGEKDLSLALELGESLSVDLPFTRLALEKFAANLGVPHNDNDSTKEA